MLYFKLKYHTKKFDSKTISFIIDARIVKLMKRNLRMQYSVLGRTVQEQLINEWMILAKTKDIKLIVTNLIEREFLNRNEQDANLLQYIV